MTFKAKEKEIKLKPDCKDFTPYMFKKEYCKLSAKCANAGTKYEQHYQHLGENYCTGIKWERIYKKIGLINNKIKDCVVPE